MRSLWCLFGSGAAVSSRGSCLSNVITRTRKLSPCTPRGVCQCLRSWWFLSRGAEARRRFGLRLNLSSRSLWVRALCCSYLPLRGLMLLALLWMNWVLAIPVFYIWKAYCILDRSFPWPRYIKGWGWTRFMCGLFWSWAHTHTHTHTHCQLLRAICVHHLTRSVLVTLDQCFSKSGPGPTSISYFKSTNYISYFGKRMLNL